MKHPYYRDTKSVVYYLYMSKYNFRVILAFDSTDCIDTDCIKGCVSSTSDLKITY